MKIDILIEKINVYNTVKKVFEEKNVTICGEKFYFLSSKEISGLDVQNRIDGSGKYMVPGLIDIHMHIESSMTTPSIFSKAVLSYGVTTVVADSHEITNVFGMEGLTEFIQSETEVDIFHAIPSSVPSTTCELETTGGVIGLKEVKQLLDNPRVICLGEAMNFKGIAYEPNSFIRQIIDLCQKKRPTMPLEGHCPQINEEELAAFLYSGISSDHTHQFPNSLEEKIENGVFIQFQNKSITPENMSVIMENKYYEYACFVTDDVMVDELLEGHLNENLKKAVVAGLPIEEAIYMTTYTPARRMGLHDRGMIAPGKIADFILLDDINEFSIFEVYKSGKSVYRKDKKIEYPSNVEQFPLSFMKSIQCRKLKVSDLKLSVKTNLEKVRCNVIQKQEVGTFTKRITKEISVKNGFLDWENSECALLVVMERYGKNGNIAYALVEEPIEKKGSIGTTWAHDHHNLMVMGNNIQDILITQQELLHIQGGYVVSQEGEITAKCPLPIGGILSQAPINQLGNDLKLVRNAMKNLGYQNRNEIMSFSTLSLPVSPEIKITDKGMLNTKTQEFYPLVYTEDGEVQ